jgi:hypothetical protein
MIGLDYRIREELVAHSLGGLARASLVLDSEPHDDFLRPRGSAASSCRWISVSDPVDERRRVREIALAPGAGVPEDRDGCQPE